MQKMVANTPPTKAGSKSVKSGGKRAQRPVPQGLKVSSKIKRSSLPSTSGADMTLYLEIDASLRRLESLFLGYKWHLRSLINGDLTIVPSLRQGILETILEYKNAILKDAQKLPPVKAMPTNRSAKPMS